MSHCSRAVESCIVYTCKSTCYSKWNQLGRHSRVCGTAGIPECRGDSELVSGESTKLICELPYSARRRRRSRGPATASRCQVATSPGSGRSRCCRRVRSVWMQSDRTTTTPPIGVSSKSPTSSCIATASPSTSHVSLVKLAFHDADMDTDTDTDTDKDPRRHVRHARFPEVIPVAS